MHLTPTTPLALLLCLAIVVVGPKRGLVLTFATLPFGSAAAINLAGLGSVFVAEVGMASLCISAVLRGVWGTDILRVLKPSGAGFPLFLLFLFAIVGSYFLPQFFAGQTEVFTLVRQSDGASLALRYLYPGGSNLGQLVRFGIAAGGFYAVALVVMRFATARDVLLAFTGATAVHLALAFLDLMSAWAGVSLLEPLRNAYVEVLDDQVLLGVRRLIAGFPEPSAFAIFTIGLYGFWLHQWFVEPQSKVRFAIVLVLAALLIRSTSTAAYLGLTLFTALFFLWQLRSVFQQKAALVFYSIFICLLPVIAGTAILFFQKYPALYEFAQTIVFDKLSSRSGIERMAWNSQALRNFVDTYGMGVGIGSLRTSGWGFAVLGSFGVIGTLLYLWFLARVFRPIPLARRSSSSDWDLISGLTCACAAVFILSLTILPQPNLGLAFFLFAGTASGLVTRQRLGSLQSGQTQRTIGHSLVGARSLKNS